MNIIIFYTFAVILLSQGYYHQGHSTWAVKGSSNVYSTNINFPPCGQPVRAETRSKNEIHCFILNIFYYVSCVGFLFICNL
jgi:hypothetical protein